MDHPLRTLLYELFVEPPLRLLQRAFGRKARSVGVLSTSAVRGRSQDNLILEMLNRRSTEHAETLPRCSYIAGCWAEVF
jgi:hypothetical protein